MSKIEEMLNVFVESYIETALWASTDEQDQPLDKRFNAGHLSEDDWFHVVSQCADFLTRPEVRECMKAYPWDADAYKQAGHDFFLTRNGHGAGFRDGQWDGWGNHGESFGNALAEAAKATGESNLMVYEDSDGDEQITIYPGIQHTLI